MAAANYPVRPDGLILDDSGVPVSGAAVTVASVKAPDGTDVANHGATVHLSGPRCVVNYDAVSKGDAWVTLAVSKVGSTFTGLRASPAAWCPNPFAAYGDPAEVLLNDDGTLLVENVTVDGYTTRGDPTRLALGAADGTTLGGSLATVRAAIEEWSRLGRLLAAVGAGASASAFKLRAAPGGPAPSDEPGAYTGGQSLSFETGLLAGQRRAIVAYTGSPLFLVTTVPFTRAPADGDVAKVY